MTYTRDHKNCNNIETHGTRAENHTFHRSHENKKKHTTEIYGRLMGNVRMQPPRYTVPLSVNVQHQHTKKNTIIRL